MKKVRPHLYRLTRTVYLRVNCSSWKFKYHDGRVTRWWQLGRTRLVQAKM